MKRIAFFDFDGTITSKDTLLEFIRFHTGDLRYYLGMLMNSPWLIAMKLGLVSNQKAKEKVLSWFFGKMELTSFEGIGSRFAKEKIPALIRPKAMQEINKLKELGFEIIVVTASAYEWVQPWSRLQQLQLIATRLQNKEGKITGKIDGVNCHGQEKVNRVKLDYDISGYSEVYCYGDTKGDKPLLGLATVSFYRPFL